MADSDTDLSDTAVSAWAGLVRVSQHLLATVDRDLKDAGFPPLAWYDALLELRRAGDGGLRPFQLRDQMLLAQYNLSRLVDRLAAAGLVERLPSPDDGRGQVVKITAQGRALLREMWPAYRAAIRKRFASKLDPWELTELARVLQQLR